MLPLPTSLTCRLPVWAAALVVWAAALAGLRAGPLEEIAASSGLGKIEARQLTSGGMVSDRGATGSFARGIYVESCFFVKAPLAAVTGALLHWDPTRFKETEVSAYRTYHEPAPDLFSGFGLLASRGADRWLVDATLSAAGDSLSELHLAASDSAYLRPEVPRNLSAGTKEARANAIWQQILRARSEAMAGGGLGAVPAYTTGGVTIAAAAEFKSLLKMTPAIATRFAAVTEARPFNNAAGTAVDEMEAYAEQSLVRGHTSYCLGVLAARKPALAGSWQVVDCTYYAADTYFLSLALHELWPWENGTLVWRVDYASAPFRGYTGGLDKVIAGREMVKEAAQSTRLFRREVERSQKGR